MKPPARFGFVLIAVPVLVADQLSKWLVSERMHVGERIPLLPFLQLHHIRNEGVAFGLLSEHRTLVIVATVVMVGLLSYAISRLPRNTWLATAGAGAVLGGAAGNVLDRIRMGHVVDFFELPHWPTFNIADIAIVLGVGALLLTQIRMERSPNPGHNDAAAP